jgi:hypothetical protein
MLEHIARLARLSFPVLFILSILGAAMLYFHVTGPALQWLVGLYFIVAVPTIIDSLLRPLSFWKETRGPPQDIPDEWR